MVVPSGRLVLRNRYQREPHAFLAGVFQYVPRISTDGFSAYPEAVDLAFGPYVKCGTIVKDYRTAEQPGRYASPEMVVIERRGVFGIR